jgi:enterochelin esterase family protein
MKPLFPVLLASALSGIAASAQTPAAPAAAVNPDAHYHLGPDSLEEDGVPKGEIRGPFTLPSQAYPGTQHTYWVYVPAQYNPAAPAGLMVFNDGQAFMAPRGDLRAQNVLDNLIYRREIPVMIGVFINPGRRPDQPEPNQQEWGDRTTNRPTEYNSMDDLYARVIVDELLPVLYKEYNISKDPDTHGIGGVSSGGIAAFEVAWQRPDSFHKVFTIVGSFVNLRGGYVYPDLIRKSPKKPIRIFLNDGRNDNRGVRPGGAYDETRDWFLQNNRLLAALTEKGYDVNYTWGMNKHGSKMGGEVLPEMMRWLWRDHAVSTDPNDTAERAFFEPAVKPEPKKPVVDTSGKVDPLEGIWQGYDGEWGHVSRQLIALADAIPADKYSWRPATGVRSVSEVFMHIALANFYLLSVTGPKMPAEITSTSMEKTVTAKADVVDWLKRSLEAVKAGRAALQPGDLARKVKIGDRDATVDGMYLRIIVHANEHMGQLIAYARMNGIVPPWSN